MNKKTLIISLAALALSSCRFFTEQKEKPEEISQNSQENPEIPKKKPDFSGSRIQGTKENLIEATDAITRTKNVDKGRNDPFALIPVEPIITIKPTAPKDPTPPKVNPSNQNESINPPNTEPKPPLNPNPTPPEPTIRSEPPLPPPPPQPVLAQGVTVTGLIQVGDVTKIIVKAPDEKYSRYVESGQYLSNGQVLVKRIETQGSNPMVVLEQLGIEVVKQVGNKAI